MKVLLAIDGSLCGRGQRGRSPESEEKMKSLNVWRIMLAIVVLFSFTVGEAYAQRRRGQVKGTPRYDRTTEVTMRGTVEKVESQIGGMGWNGTHLVVRFEAETLKVLVGPSHYLAQKGFAFAVGDDVEVTGSKVKFEGHDILVTREIRKGDWWLTLRDKQGIPVWSRSRWRY
ncbi:MAG TPA: hypothetical protein VJ124_12325 [Pyrinomonadaceae bacterium]|nr:hypothetical protein [Pyrinomonadaceae bacterium]